MSLNRYDKRVDENQQEVIDALKKIGVSVEIIGKPLDLLLCVRGETMLMEVKSIRPTSEGGRHGLTVDQIKFIARWPGKVHVVSSAAGAINAVLGEAMK